MNDSKACNKCGEVKSLSEFHKKLDGHQPSCKVCRAGGATVECVECGCQFPRRKYVRICSDECERRRRARLNGESAAARRSKRPDRVLPPCPECGKAVVYSGMGALPKFCSQKCKTRVHSRRMRRRIALVDLAERACRECGVSFKPTRSDGVYCSKRCYYRGNGKRPKFTRELRTCIECGVEYEAWRHDQRFCKPKCAFLFHGRARQNRSRTGAASPYFDREIFERDGWMCWLCNEPVDPSLSRKDRRGATIDHVIPLSRGGSDEADNVRLAHWGCNNEKHTRIVA